jgi:NitT/TauT family transport system substrate-binding protein
MCGINGRRAFGGVMTFRAIVLFFVALVTYRFAFAPALGQSEPTLRVITTPIEDSAGVYYAQGGGFFAKSGLQVDIQAMNSGEVAASAVAGGAADIGVMNVLSMSIAHQRGIGLRFIAPASEYVENAPTTLLVVAQDSPIRAARDLIGKTVAVAAVGDVKTIATKAWLVAQGVDPAQVRFIEVPGPQTASALQQHVVDAGMLSEPFLSDARLQKLTRAIASPFSAIAPRFILNGWYAKESWIAGHRDEVKRFSDAVAAGQAWAMSNPQASGAVLIQVAKIKPTVLAGMKRATFASRFDPALLQPVVNVAAKFNLIDASFPAPDLYTAAANP